MTDFDAVMVDAMLEAGAELEEFGPTVARTPNGRIRPEVPQMVHSVYCYTGESTNVIDRLISRTVLAGFASPLNPMPVHDRPLEELSEELTL